MSLSLSSVPWVSSECVSVFPALPVWNRKSPVWCVSRSVLFPPACVPFCGLFPRFPLCVFMSTSSSVCCVFHHQFSIYHFIIFPFVLFTLIPAVKRSLSSFLSASLHLGPILPAALSYSWHNVEENLPIAQVCSILIETAGTNWMQSEDHICYNFQCYHSTSWDNQSRCNVFNKIIFCICVNRYPRRGRVLKWNRRKDWHRTGKQVNR